jgi:predicted Zn-dependent peptidase
VKEGKDPAAVEAAIHEEVARLQSEPIPAEELQKVKNQGKAGAFRRLSSPFSILIQLLYYDGLGDWKYINSYADEVDAVTAADIQRVARAYLTKENRTVGVFLRKEAAPAPSPTPPGAPGDGTR